MKSGKDAASEGIRTAQAQALLDLAATTAQRSAASDAPGATAEVLLAADLNAEAQVDPKIGDPLAYRAIRSHALGLCSAYAAMPGAVPMDGASLEPPYTTWKRRPKGEIKRTIDFIFHGSKLNVAALLNMPQEDEMPDERV